MDEFTVRLKANSGNKKYNVFKFHKADSITWDATKMRRENEYQPWQIKVGNGKMSRRYKAIKEGGVGDNASYFIFYKPTDSSQEYEACPIDEWFSVSATQRYKTLTAEEAEHKFEQRHKMLNLFSVMHLKNNGGDNGDEGNGPSQESKSFKVSEMDEWDRSGDDEGSDNDDEDDEDNKKKLKRKKNVKKEKEDQDEAKEESDEGDFEQREVDYMSDSSSESSDPEMEKDESDVKGIAEEDALRDLLSTDDEEEGDNPQQKGNKSGVIKNISGLSDVRRDSDDSDDSSDSDIYDVDEDKMDDVFMKKSLPTGLSSVSRQDIKQEPDASGGNAGPSGSAVGSTAGRQQQSSGSNKRKAGPDVSTPAPQPIKRPYVAQETPASPANGHERVLEDLIKKYLSRRPMTLKALLKDIKSKLRRVNGPEFNVQTIADIINRLKPEKNKINETTYLSLKSG